MHDSSFKKKRKKENKEMNFSSIKMKKKKKIDDRLRPCRIFEVEST